VSALLGRIPSAVGYQPTLTTDMGSMQERITTTKKWSITSVQAIYADDLTDPAPATTFAHLDATTVLSRSVAERGIYPAVDPLDSTSRIMDLNVIWEEHYDIARTTSPSRILLPFWDWTSCLKGDKLKVARSRKIERFLSQPFQVAEVFTNNPGKLVPIAETISGIQDNLSGKYDQSSPSRS